MALAEDIGQVADTARRKKILAEMARMVDEAGIDLDDLTGASVKKLSVWEGFHKDAEGNAQKVTLAGVQLSPAWEQAPAWPVVQPAAPVKVTPTKGTAPQRAERVTLILPDPQIGYRAGVPTHDEAALAAAMAVLDLVQPDAIVNLGDTLDLPEWSSKFVVLPEFVQQTQPALDRTYRFLAEQRALAPLADNYVLEGNHDDRLAIAIARNGMAALRLRRANAPEEWPVNSVPFLLRLDELGVEYVGGYPAGRVKITQGTPELPPLVARHGVALDMRKVARESRQSFVQGHTHHLAEHWETYEVDGSSVTVGAFSLGCLCRVDGAVPSTKGGSDARGRVVPAVENWQQACGVVTEYPDGAWALETVPIHNGTALFRGQRVGG